MYVNYTVGVGWSNATVISDGYQGSYWNHNVSSDPAIAVDCSGNVHVVWEDGTPGAWGEGGWDYSDDLEIMYVNYSSSAGWSNATVISDGYQGSYWNHNSSSDPHIAIDNSGGIHAVWEEETPGVWGPGISGSYEDVEVAYVKFTPGSGWSNVTIISDGYGGTYWNHNVSSDPQIIADEDGILHVIWEDETGGIWGDYEDEEVMYVKYNPTSGWSQVFIVSDGYNGLWDNNDDSEDPAFALGPDGALHVVYEDGNNGAWGTDDEIWYSRIFIPDDEPPHGPDDDPPPDFTVLIITFVVVGGVVLGIVIYADTHADKMKNLSKTMRPEKR